MCIEDQYLNINYILQILPHRYPFLLIDRIIACKKFHNLHAIKNCTINEPYFQGHFSINPIVPGVLILESMVQSAGLLIYKSTGELNIQKKYYFIGIDEARFKKNVIPGDQMLIKVLWLKSIHKIIKLKSYAIVNKTIVCRATVLFSKK